MISADRIRGILHDLARCFENEAQDPGAWGQFLDLPRGHTQIGIYGTSAGLITLAAAQRGLDALTLQASGQLAKWWAARNRDPYLMERTVQNLRLAFMHLALRLGTPDSVNDTRAQIEQELFSRLLPSGMWGDYWSSGDRHDQTPRSFTSAIALLSFLLHKDPDDPLDARLLQVADRLEQRITSGDVIPPYELAAIAVAVLGAKGGSVSRPLRRRFARAAKARPAGLDEQGVYFFDFEYQAEGQRRYGRDYFIVPTRVLLALAGFQQGAPSALRLLAQGLLDLVAANLATSNGTYRPEPGARVSTVDQAWVALLFRAGELCPDSPGPIPRLWFNLVRVRKENWFLDTAFPVAAMISAVSLSTVHASLNRQSPSGAIWVDVVATLASFLIGGIYGTRFLQRLLPGRQ